MKAYSAALQAAIAAGDVRAAGAINIATAVDPAQVWSGYGDLVLPDGLTYKGVGAAGLVKVTGGQLGSAQQSVELVLSGLEPAIVGMLDEVDVRRAPVVIWRVFFNGAGTVFLGAHVFRRGRIDALRSVDIPGGTASINATVEGAAAGLGRSTGRMRADADQRLNDPTDGGFQWVTAAPLRTLAWGGKPPARAGAILPGVRPDGGGLIGDVMSQFL